MKYMEMKMKLIVANNFIPILNTPINFFKSIYLFRTMIYVQKPR